MILTEYVNVKIIKSNKKRYIERGYNIDSQYLDIKPSDLPNHSRVKVSVMCDVCYKEKEISYCNYYKSYNNGNFYSCSSECAKMKVQNTNLEKFGVLYASQNEKIKEKIKATNLEKFGSECSLHNFEINKKTIKTNLEKFGHVFPSQSDIIKSKTKKTNLRKFGTTTPLLNIDIQCKIKTTLLEKYGVDNPMKNDSIKNKVKETNLRKYGVECSLYNEDVNKKTIKTIEDKYGDGGFYNDVSVIERRKNTNIERYGTEYTFSNIDIQHKSAETKNKKYNDPYYNNIDKIKVTNLEKYGFCNISQNNDIKERIKNTNINRYGNSHTLNLPHVQESRESGYKKYLKINKDDILIKYKSLIPDNFELLSYDDGYFNVLHNDCGKVYDISVKHLYDRLRTNANICLNCKPIGDMTSSGEQEISNWLLSIGVVVLSHDRTILKNNKEIDIFLPEYNLAIEYNGLYWHSELFKNKKYHLNKTIECIENNINLIHIFEDDWIYKKDIVKSIILNKISKTENRIFARKTLIKLVSVSDAKKFLDDNHIQGYSRSKYKIGLYSDDKLVSIMTFGYRLINSKKEFELIRFCNKKNTNVIGASSKLFNYFTMNYDYDTIISYCDISLFNGDVYNMLGFKKSHLSRPNYFWVVNNMRHHRFKYNKKKLVMNGFDNNKTEREIMWDRGYYRIWGCGQEKFIFRREINEQKKES